MTIPQNPSDQVLLSIARALRLDEDATAYLLQLGRPASRRRRRSRKPEKVSDSIRDLIEGWPLTPAYLHGRYMDVLAANRLAAGLSPFLVPGRYAILDAFAEPEMRELHQDWEEMTARGRPYLRSVAGPDVDDPRLVELVGELSLRSDRFRTLWARQDVRHKSTGISLLKHPPGRAAGAALREAAHTRHRHADPGHVPRPARQRVPGAPPLPRWPLA
jgi:transcription regulator MmyB-like protein